jgi:hypothetical protein
MTKAIQLMAAQKLNLRNQLDNDMFNHISYVSNQCLQIMKREGLSSESLVLIGKLLWRLFRVFQAYNEKQREVTLSRIIDIVQEFKNVFGG